MIYLRLSAAVMTVMIGVMVGLELRQRLADRERILSSLGTMCREILSYIETQGIPLGDIARRLAVRYQLMESCCRHMDDGECFTSAFVLSVKGLGELRVQEKECLFQLAHSLGRCTEDAQKRMIESVTEKLDGFAADANKEKSEKSRLYLSGGALAGAFAAVLMM